MTGQFTEIDPRRCVHYARFMSNLNLAQANSIFWLLFSAVLLLMCIASLQHHKSNALTEQDKKFSKKITSSKAHRLKNRRLRLHYLSIASLCLVLSATATVFECFALFNIEYCDGEDLMSLYWGFWSVLQVGSNIAILGVMVQFWIVLGDIETPSWAVALGTPVLVFAAIGFGLRHVAKQTIGRLRMKRNNEPDIEAQKDAETNAADDIVGPRGESGIEKRPADHDRSSSLAPTMVPAISQTSMVDSNYSPPGHRSNNSITSVEAPSIGDLSVGRHSTFWQRDLRAILNSVITDNPPQVRDERVRRGGR